MRLFQLLLFCVVTLSSLGAVLAFPATGSSALQSACLAGSYDEATRTLTIAGTGNGDYAGIVLSVDPDGSIFTGCGVTATIGNTDTINIDVQMPIKLTIPNVRQFLRNGNEVKINVNYPTPTAHQPASTEITLKGFGRRAHIIGRGNWLDLNGDGDNDLQLVPGIVSNLNITTGRGPDIVNLHHFTIKTAAAGADDTYALGAGNNVFIGGTDRSRVLTGNGRDRIYGGTGFDQVFSGAGNDLFIAGPNRGSIYAGPGNDVLIGGTGNDMLFGQAGNDILKGRAGNDGLAGGKGNDRIYGGPGNDSVYDNDGTNIIYGGPGTDRIVTNNTSIVRCGTGRPAGWGQC